MAEGKGATLQIQAPSHQKSGKWKMGKLGDYVRIELGGTPNTAKSEYWGGGVILLGLILEKSINLESLSQQKLYTKLGFENQIQSLYLEGAL